MSELCAKLHKDGKEDKIMRGALTFYLICTNTLLC